MGGLPPITALKLVSVAHEGMLHGCGTPLVEGTPRRPSLKDMGGIGYYDIPIPPIRDV